MSSIGDIVVLRDGSVGVVGEVVPSPGPQIYRVFFSNEHVTTTDADIQETLASQEYEVGDTISLWPYSGEITAIDGDEFTISIVSQELLEFGPVAWVGVYKAPRWQVVRSNDTRINRL